MTELNPQNCSTPKPRTINARITFSCTGSIFFNKPAIKMLKLDKNSQVVFLIDENEIMVAKSKNGFEMSAFKSTQTGFSNKMLIRKIAEELGIEEGKTFRMNLKPEVLKKKGYEIIFELDRNYK